jgi:hypothetical protein
LKHLRIVLLQDSVVLKQKFPDFFMWSHSISSNFMSVEFETQLSAQVFRETNPLQLRIQQALHELCDRLDLQRIDSLDRMTLIESKLGVGQLGKPRTKIRTSLLICRSRQCMRFEVRNRFVVFFPFLTSDWLISIAGALLNTGTSITGYSRVYQSLPQSCRRNNYCCLINRRHSRFTDV